MTACGGKPERIDCHDVLFCKGDSVKSVTSHMIELEHTILIVKNVPCHRCTQCGEVTLGSDVIERLDMLASRFSENMTEVAVISYLPSGQLARSA